MLRVFGVKIDKDTGEILKEKTLIFRCISEADYEKRGKKNAESHGYTVTEVWKIGTVANGWGNIRIS
jgi:hypothetical protein